MKPVFADAYYFFALLNAHDEAHEHVIRFNAALRNPIVTSAWVLTEVGDGIAGTPSRAMFKKASRPTSRRELVPNVVGGWWRLWS